MMHGPGASGPLARGARLACGVGVDICCLGWRKLVRRYQDISANIPLGAAADSGGDGTVSYGRRP
jgi:hypothetical protein